MITRRAIRCVACALVLTGAAGAQTAQEILDAMDRHRTFGTVSYEATMEIHIDNQVRTKRMKTVAVADQKALVEFINPQDQGVKYLKLNKDLWIYFPSEQDMVKISGHLLKEGMMGSDISYEDALESDAVRTRYTARIDGEEEIDGVACWILHLEATVKNVPYHGRRIWVDKTSNVPRREQMFAKSGKLLKESRVLEVQKIGNRLFATRVEMSSKLRKNSKTVFTMENVVFDLKLDDNLFTLQNLQR